MPPLAAPDRSAPTQNLAGLRLRSAEGRFHSSRAIKRNITMLLVEDSRFASDALRLISGRLGMRMRRAETIEAARSHLRTYLPDIVVVDLGLPDGAGDELIRQIVQSPLRPALVLGSSGAEDGRERCLGAGADGYLPKPVENVASLADLIQRLCPDVSIALHPSARNGTDDTAVSPDPLAFKDDLSRAVELLADPEGKGRLASYVGPFLTGIAGCAHDDQLAAAVRKLVETEPDRREGESRRTLERLIRGRLTATSVATLIS